MIIDSANKRKIGQSPDLPDMTAGIQMFFQRMIIKIVMKRNHEGLLKEYTSTIKTMGVRITQSPQQLTMKPEGERDWKWSNLYTLPEPKLKVDDIVVIQETRYRVMQKNDNKEYSCMSYELLEDYNEE